MADLNDCIGPCDMADLNECMVSLKRAFWEARSEAEWWIRLGLDWNGFETHHI